MFVFLSIISIIDLWKFAAAYSRTWILLSFFFFMVLQWPTTADAKDYIKTGSPSESIMVGHFSKLNPSQALPDEWSPLLFDSILKHTRYELVREDNLVTLKATSRSSASGLSRMVPIDLSEYPILEWKWKVTHIFKKGDMRTKSGNDSPAQLSVKFQYLPERADYWNRMKHNLLGLIRDETPPVAAIIYFWANRLPKETIITSPYTDRVKLIAVESGATGLNGWRTEKRNVFQDYRLAFGEPPPLVMCVAIMTDTDNTNESAVTYYGDIIFHRIEHNSQP